MQGANMMQKVQISFCNHLLSGFWYWNVIQDDFDTKIFAMKEQFFHYTGD